jgi:hypothetical protein
MSLLTLQRRMRGHLLSGDAIVATDLRGDPAAGLAVYHNAYRVQLIECLRDTYEKLSAWLGDDAFEAAARRHIETNPPQSWTLADYGGNFADTLIALYPEDPEVLELAWLDWTLRRAFDGANADPVNPGQLGDIDWDAAVFTFVPTLTLGSVTTNCAALWSAMAAEQMPPAVMRLLAASDLLVWRRDLSPQFKTLSALEAHALRLGLAGTPFGEICQFALHAAGESQAAAVTSQLLATWLRDGIVSGVQ